MRKRLKLVVRQEFESESEAKKLAALVASALSGSSAQASQAQVRSPGASGQRPGGRERLIPFARFVLIVISLVEYKTLKFVKDVIFGQVDVDIWIKGAV